MKYEKDLEAWMEWSYQDIVKARAAAFKKLGMPEDIKTPNAVLCRKLGLEVDVFAPQRLIKWSVESGLVER